MRKIILASSSPRRAELMRQAGYDFDVVPPDDWAECGICSRETPPEMVARLAAQKAENVVAKVSHGLVVACDTIAEVVGQVLGKPAGREHAERMLRTLSGREHRVYSGLVLWDAGSGRRSVDVEVSVLRMDRLSESQLRDYLDSGQWEGKAGAFGYQDKLGWVRLLRGSESNVVGLPMELLRRRLEEMTTAEGG